MNCILLVEELNTSSADNYVDILLHQLHASQVRSSGAKLKCIRFHNCVLFIFIQFSLAEPRRFGFEHLYTVALKYLFIYLV